MSFVHNQIPAEDRTTDHGSVANPGYYITEDCLVLCISKDVGWSTGEPLKPRIIKATARKPHQATGLYSKDFSKDEFLGYLPFYPDKSKNYKEGYEVIMVFKSFSNYYLVPLSAILWAPK